MWLNVYYYVDPVSKQRQKSHSSSCPPSQKMPKVLSWWELRASLGFILNCCSCTQMHGGHHAEWLVLLPHTLHLPARIVCELFEGRGLVSSLVYHPKHLLVHVVTPAGNNESFLCARYCSKHWGKIQPASPHWVLLRAVQDGQYYNQLPLADKNTQARSEATCRRSHSYSIAKLEFDLLSLCLAASVLNRSAAIIP